MNKVNFSKYLAEFIGTFAMVFAGCGAVVVSGLYSLPPLAIPLVFGLIVAAMIYAVGHISGAHFNPAVTIAFAIARHFPKRQILPYLISQYGGGLLAIGLLAFLFPETQTFGETLPHLSLGRSFVWEMVLTFFLMFVIISVATDTRAAGMMAGVAIGGTVTLCALFGGPVTGASMNPARSFAPNLFASQSGVLWLYTLAPVVGAVLAALIYEFIRCEAQVDCAEKPDQSAKGCC